MHQIDISIGKQIILYQWNVGDDYNPFIALDNVDVSHQTRPYLATNQALNQKSRMVMDS